MNALDITVSLRVPLVDLGVTVLLVCTTGGELLGSEVSNATDAIG